MTTPSESEMTLVQKLEEARDTLWPCEGSHEEKCDKCRSYILITESIAIVKAHEADKCYIEKETHAAAARIARDANLISHINSCLSTRGERTP